MGWPDESRAKQKTRHGDVCGFWIGLAVQDR
jgi:hypothetical protein